MGTLIKTITDFLKDNLAGQQNLVHPELGDPPLPGKLADIGAIVTRLTNVGASTDPDANGLVDWLSAIMDTGQDVLLRDTILVRVLQLRAPRIAEALVLAGLIKVEFQETGTSRAFAFRIDWTMLGAYLRDPGTEIRNTLIPGRIQNLEDFEIAQMLTGKLVFTPRHLLIMEYMQQGFAALPNPKTTGAVDLLDLLGKLVHSPMKLMLPFAPTQNLDTFNKQVKDSKNALSDYIAFTPFKGGQIDGFGIELNLSDIAGFATKSLDLGSGWKLSASTTGSGPLSFALETQTPPQPPGSKPALALKLTPNTNPNATFDVKVNWSASGDKPAIGRPDRTRLQVGAVGGVLRIASPLSVRASVQQLELVIAAKDLGLLAKILPLPAEIKLQTDVNIAYVQGVGLQFGAAGGAVLGAECAIPLDLQVGPKDAGIKFDNLRARLEIQPQPAGVQGRIMLRVGANGHFGPLSVSADGVGVWFGKWTTGTGSNAVTKAFDVLPPTGFGASLDAGPVSGGGFLGALPGDQYAGGLGLKVLGISVGAYALFGEAEGAPAFVGILGVRLPPPGVQIGFGFAVTGVGGVVGINRRADTDVLREQLASGASAEILFCDDPTKNGLAIIGQLPRMFPAAKGVFLVGPTLQLSWLDLFKVDAGIFIELPGPREIFVAGSARLVIGSESFALVYLRMDFIGGVDLTKSLIYFDAALVNSQVLQVFKITGGVALRIAYGENGYFLFSVGGFHPSFNPGGLQVPQLARAGTSASVAIAWLKLENYFALTSNTFQLGAGVEVGVEIGPIAAHGWFRFDALAQFDPFQFTATIDAGFDVEVEGVSLCGVRVTGTMSGPGPIVVYASASVKVLFVRISKHVTVTFGDAGAAPLKVIDDQNLVALIAPEVKNPANIRCEGDDASVVLRPDAPSTVNNMAVVGVVGQVIWEQKRVPFGVDLQRFEGTPLPPAASGALHHLTVTGSNATPETDWFGNGSFMNVADAEALNNARFVEAQSGLRMGTTDGPSRGGSEPCDLTISLVKLPKRTYVGKCAFGSYLSPELAGMRAERSGNAKAVSGGPRVKAGQEKWTAYDKSGGQVATGLSSTQAFQAARGGKGFAQPAAVGAVSLQGVF